MGLHLGKNLRVPQAAPLAFGELMGGGSAASSTQRMPQEGSEVFSAKYQGPGVKNTSNNS